MPPQSAEPPVIQKPNARLEVFIPYSKGVPMEEALRRADEAGVVIASNKRLSEALVYSEEWRTIREVYPCWTGTMTAYTKPGEKFGKVVEYVDPETKHRWVFPVPEEHQGKTDAILVAEHPDFSLEADENSRIVRAARVDLIERFPASNDWYSGDSKHDIPHGNKVDSPYPDARYLERKEKKVGLVSRCYYDHYYVNHWRLVNSVYWPSDWCGVAVIRYPEFVFDGPSPYRSAPRVVNGTEHEKQNPKPENKSTILSRLQNALGV